MRSATELTPVALKSHTCCFEIATHHQAIRARLDIREKTGFSEKECTPCALALRRHLTVRGGGVDGAAVRKF
jgi:hypothetical protein